MQCIDEEKLLDYTEGSIEGPELRLLEAHLQGCQGCQKELAMLKQSWECLDAWQPIEPSPLLRARVWEEIRLAPPPVLSWGAWARRAMRGLSLGVTTMACALFCTFHLNLVVPGSSPVPTSKIEVAQSPPSLDDQDLVAMDWQMGDVELFSEPDVSHEEDVKIGRISHRLMEGTHEALQEALEN